MSRVGLGSNHVGPFVREEADTSGPRRRRLPSWPCAVLAVSVCMGHPTDTEGQHTTAPPATYHLDYGLGGQGLLRYNRAEGLFAGVAAERTVERLSLTASAGFAVTDPVPQLTVGTTWKGTGQRLRAELFHRMRAFNPEVQPLGIANSLSALAAGRDEGEYYRATGAVLEVSAPTHEPSWSVTLYFERQQSPASNADFSLVGWPIPDNRGRPLAIVRPLRQVGLAGEANRSWGTDRAAPSAAAWVRGRAETGGARMADVTVAASATVPLGRIVRSVVQGGAHGSRGDVSPQRMALLGGPSRVRGFEGAAATGPTAVWGRAELLARAQIVTVVAFADVGWAGTRSGRTVSSTGSATGAATPSTTLASAGLGLNLLDDVIRAHVARRVRGGGGWQFHLYLDPLR